MAREKPTFLNGLFIAERRLGKGGMGQVLEVVADRESAGFPGFLAEIVGWREATRGSTHHLANLESAIHEQRTRLDEKEQEES